MAAPRLVLDAHASAAEAGRLAGDASVPGAPVVDDEGRYVGVFTAADGAPGTTGTAGHMADPTVATVALSASLFEAFDALPDGQHWLTVLDDDRRVRGIIAVGDIVRAYRRAAEVDNIRINAVASDAELLEVRVGSDSPVQGRRLDERLLPTGTLVVSVARDGTVLPAEASTVLGEGSLVTVLTAPAHLERVRVLLSGSSNTSG
ncbi:CBS domain-containing protein [Speluncibacter jeojiensis]|uniref:CBS domain-containing protein n=1 Tax=Speluncibacter jeojiensis TaxID=2710754 RepID=A0A9X4M4Z9_9ACTN|nr:CBS domain-containing protein [Rhodococcus sp. D2-41]MDG3014551.1 CBS domain-containing protein [Corynebacteriales bacterium D3-21]